MTESQRDELKIVIEEHALAWAVGKVMPKEIDEINILNASFLAMHRALDQLGHKPELLLIDGNRFNAYSWVPHQCIVGGDHKYRSIAAASILAKTYRDGYMKKLAEDFPHYGWEKNKGYPTKSHRTAIHNHGATIHHRHSFKLLP